MMMTSRSKPNAGREGAARTPSTKLACLLFPTHMMNYHWPRSSALGRSPAARLSVLELRRPLGITIARP